MLGLGWLTLKQAQEALRSGRLEEAHRLLTHGSLQGQRHANDLRGQLVKAYAERGEKYLRRFESAAAWKDLLRAEELGIADNAILTLRNTLTRLGLAEVRAVLEAGEPDRALEVVAQLRQRGVRNPELDSLEEGARDWSRACELAEMGEFSQALPILERVQQWLPTFATALERLRASVEDNKQAFAPVLLQVHEAAQHNRWQDVLQLSEQLLARAPRHAEVRRLRSLAWRAIEPSTIVAPLRTAARPAPELSEPLSRRFLLWIDGVGGFLLCLDAKVTIGQAAPEAGVDVPIFADISRLHATLIRDSEGYVLRAMRPLTVNNQDVEQRSLKAGDRITLSSACQLQFRQDVPISASARLDLMSGQRFGVAVDGVLLMAETLVLGSGPQVHITMPSLRQPVILYQNKEGLGIRCPGSFQINGQSVKDRGILEAGSRVCSPDFSLTLEAVGRTPGVSS